MGQTRSAAMARDVDRRTGSLRGGLGLSGGMSDLALGPLWGALSGTGTYFRINGRISIVRKKISAPSDWNRIFPFVRLDFVPIFTT